MSGVACPRPVRVNTRAMPHGWTHQDRQPNLVGLRQQVQSWSPLRQSSRTRVAAPPAALSQRATGSAVCALVAAPRGGLLMEDMVRASTVSAMRSTLAIPSAKVWVVDYMAEAVLASLGAGASDGLEDLKGMPCTLEDAVAVWGPVLTEQLDDVGDDDVQCFCKRLWHDLTQLAREQGTDAGDDGGEGMTQGTCELCERQLPLTKHHLIPRDVHKEWKKRGCTSEQLQAAAMVCRPCHNAIHRVADNKTLARLYNTIDILLQDPSIQRHVGWARKQRVALNPETLPQKYQNRR